MFLNIDKRRLYWLIDECLAGRMSSPEFCDVYYVCYDLELVVDSLSEVGHSAFKGLSDVVGRFSQFDDDIKEHPGVYYSEGNFKRK